MTPQSNPDVAPTRPHLLDRLSPAAALLISFAAGALAGQLAAWAFDFHSYVPSERELRDLCSVAPGVRPRQWSFIILHHSGADSGNAAIIDYGHRHERGWPQGLGYDFVIGNGHGSGDGEIEVGNRWRRQLDGAHCEADNMNARAIGICFIGNFERRSPTRAQRESGAALIRRLARLFHIPPERVLGHREAKGAQTDCPGRLFPLDTLRAAAD